MTVSNPPFWLPHLNGIWGAARNDMWAVGSGYLRERYTGTAWTGSTNTITDWLWSIWGSSASNVWAVGSWGAVYRWDGRSWTESTVGSEANWLWTSHRGVWGVGPNEVYIAGDYDPNGTADGDNSGAVWKYNGSRWSFFWRDTVPDLLAIWGTSGSDFYVSGRGGKVARYNGTAFTVEDTRTTRDLWSIWGSGGSVFAVGANGTIVRRTAGAATGPAISSGGVTNSASGGAALAPGAFASIYGQRLAPATRNWDGAIVGGKLPVQLEGVSVTVGGRPAAISFLSPNQVNALLSSDEMTGNVEVKVTTPEGTAAVNATVQRYTPAFFLWESEGRKYAAATHADWSLVGKVGMIPGAVSRPAEANEDIVLWGSGFGPTNPPTPSLEVIQAPFPVMPELGQLRVTIGGREAQASYAGVPFAGVWQLNLKAPAGLAAGDHLVVATIGGQSSQAAVYLTMR
jgi:uncharacterized protein (TIGR03437 family)